MRAQRLSEAAVMRLRSLETEAARPGGPGRAGGDRYDPGRRASRWATAGRLATLLQRFEATGWRRIQRGGRQPRNPAEAAMSAMLQGSVAALRRKRICDLIS